MVANLEGEPAYENRFRSRPISGGRDLPCFRLEWLSELHAATPAGGHRGTVYGCTVRLASPVGDLRVSGNRGGNSSRQSLRAVGAGRPGAGDRQHSLLPRFDGPERASAGPLRGCTVGGDLRRCATGFCRAVPAAAAGTGLRGCVMTSDAIEPRGPGTEIEERSH